MTPTNGYINGQMSNGNGTHWLPCESDYEERPLIDVTPSKPRNRWRDDLAPVTMCMNWGDNAGITYSATFRADDVETALEMMKPVIAGIRKAAEKKAAVAHPAQPDAPEPEFGLCKLHNVPGSSASSVLLTDRAWQKREQMAQRRHVRMLAVRLLLTKHETCGRTTCPWPRP